MSNIKKIGQNFWEIISKPEMGVLPGQIAFFLVLSIIPMVTLVGCIGGFFSLSIHSLSEFVVDALPKDVTDLLLPYITTRASKLNIILFMILGFVVASNGCYSIICACNTLYQVRINGYLKNRFKAIVLTLILVVLFVFVIAFLAFGDVILNAILHFGFLKGMSEKLYFVFLLLKWPMALLIIFVVVKLIYKFAPDQNIEGKYLNNGTLFTSFSWLFVTAIYSFYVNNFAYYDLFYGAVANIVILMFWVYILSYLLVIGMAINVNDYNMNKNKDK